MKERLLTPEVFIDAILDAMDVLECDNADSALAERLVSERDAAVRAETRAEWAWCAGLLKRAASTTNYDHETSIHNEALDALLHEMEATENDGFPASIRRRLNDVRADERAKVMDEVRKAKATSGAIESERAEADRRVAELQARLDEREDDMHIRIRRDYDTTVADTWKAENAKVRAELEAIKRELHRWQHGQQVEGDYVCEPALEAQHELEAYKTRVREVLKRSRALALKFCDDPEADQHGWMSREAECVDIADALGIDLESEEL